MLHTSDKVPRFFTIIDAKDSLDWSPPLFIDESDFKASSSSSFDA